MNINNELADVTGQIQGLVNERFALLKSYQSGQISKDRYAGQVERIERQADALDDHRKSIEATKKAVAKYGGAAQMPAAGAEFGAPIAERKSDSGKHWAELVNNAPYFASPTMADAGQRQQLEMAVASKMPARIELKAAERSRLGGFQYGAQSKAAMTEGSFSPQLPGLEMPNKYLSFPYEPTRLSSYLPGAAMDRYSAFWISETAHGAEAAATAEGGTKPDLSPTLTNNEVVSQKIAGLFSYTYEIELDVPGGVSGWILYSLQRSIINQENNLLLNASTGSSDSFNGWLNTSSTLTQSGAGLNGLDAIIQAAAAMRSSTSSFASPDLLITSPNTVAAILQEKDNQGTIPERCHLFRGPGRLYVEWRPE